VIAAIETRYAGCRFRSRLEARWAVFFDTLGTKWEYEPQGYVVGPNKTPYLPDFWLPKEKVWVEVKGSEEQLDVGLTVDAALPWDGLPDTGNEQSEYKIRLLVLGPIGSMKRVLDGTGKTVGYSGPTHSVLTFRKGDLFQGTAYFTRSGLEVQPEGGLVANDSGHIWWDTHRQDWGALVSGGGYITDPGVEVDMPVAEAFRSARSARFEHGESGA
jgi:hypothetical protein